MNKFLIAIIFLLALVLRFWNLGYIPPSLTPDEAAIGYNAYSILKTGHDEYGKYFPIIFKSFGDYKPGLYIYLTIPAVALFGLTEFSVRFASALTGVITVYLIYKLSHIWFGKKTAIFAALVAACNPWLIYFSRGAWESNVSLMLTLLGVVLFIKALKNSKYIIISGISFALTFLTYQGAKLSTLIVLLILLSIYRDEIFRISKKYLTAATVLALLIVSPIILSLFNGQSERLTVFSIFSYKRPDVEIQIYKDVFYSIFHSEPINYFRAILGRWFNVFSGDFLFFSGDNQNPVHTAPYQGVLLMSDLLFLPLGLFYILKNKIKREHLFMLLWLVLAPLSAAISRDTTNAVRSLNTSIPLIMISAFGINFLTEYYKKFGKILIFTAVVPAFIYFLDAYYIHVPAHNSDRWRYGYKQAVVYLLENKSKYRDIVFEQSYNQPYIYYLFYSKEIKNIDLSVGENIKDVGLVKEIDGIRFEKIDWPLLKNKSGTLIVASPASLPPDYQNDAQRIKEIKYLNDRDTAFLIIQINEKNN